jgi:hypothetical protein
VRDSSRRGLHDAASKIRKVISEEHRKRAAGRWWNLGNGFIAECYSKVWSALKSLSSRVEDQDYDPKDEIGADLPGFRRSRTCKGLNLSDGGIDSAHIYWDHEARRFEDWVR